MGKGNSRAKGKAEKKAAAAKSAAIGAGARVKCKPGSAFAGELGEVQSTDGETALVKLDAKDVEQAIPHEQLARA